MQRWKSFPRFFLLAVLLIGLLAGISAPAFVSQNAKAAPVNAPLLACPDPTIAQWTFTGMTAFTSYPIMPSTGLGALQASPAITSSPTFPVSVSANPPAISFSGWPTTSISINNLYYIEFGVDTTGRNSIGVTLSTSRSGTGPLNFDIYYSVDGINFTPFQLGEIVTTPGETIHPFNFSGISTLNNNSNVKFRLYAYGATSAAGTWRLDDIAITGNCVISSLPIISEVAWAGTQASIDDEWVELYNPGPAIDISDWRLVSSDGIVDVVFPTGTILLSGDFFLLERTRQQVTNVPYNLLYTGALSDGGVTLRLSKPDGSIVDTANSDGGSWPAGASASFSSMERVINGGLVSPDSIGGWLTFADTAFVAKDAANNDIHGTPGNPNWAISITLTPSNTPTPTITFTPSVTPTITGTRPTPTRTGTATRTATPNPPLLTVIINEVAWMGTIASTSDEWIELYNPGSVAIDLTGWVLRADDESPFITWNSLDLTNVFIQPGQYYLLERTDDTTVTSFTANKIYSNALDDSPGDVLKLFDAQGRLIDTANSNGGDWPAGVSTSTFRRSMERTTPIIQDGVASWATFAGTDSGARDANNGIINGTPGFKNWVSNITLTPSRTPTATRRVTNTFTPRPRTATPTPFGGPVPVGRPFINEFLPRPGFDWNLDGKVDTFDEFIELKNVGNADMNLSGWRLDDSADFPGALSSAPYTITDLILKPGEYAVFYASQTNILLSDGGDSVRLFDSSGNIMDVIDFTIAKVEDESVCRLPDGNGFGSWFNDCTPTPNLTNSRDGQVPTLPEDNSATPFCALPDTLPADFLFAECRGYGANIWDNFYWDEFGWMGDQIVPENKNKWKSFIE